MLHMKQYKNLPLSKELTCVYLDKTNKCYFFDYDLANVFYKGLTSFKASEVKVYGTILKTVSVFEYNYEKGYIDFYDLVRFVNAYDYLNACNDRHIKTKLVYNTELNPYKLPDKYLKIIERG